MGSDAVGFFVEAMTLTRRRQDLAPLVERTVERLHAEGLRAYAAEMAAHGWHSRLDPETSARRFWTIAIGVTLEGQAMGRSPDDLAAEMLRLLGPQADAPPAAARLTVVKTGNSAPDSLSADKEKPQ
jgi:Bacterial transcriptional repressor C-terminal